MAKSLLGGMSDYSHQSLEDIINDLDYDYRNTSAFINMIVENKEILEKNNYWNNDVPFAFKAMIEYALKHYKTAQSELKEIKASIENSVEKHHVTRLSSLAKNAHEINIDLGKVWHQQYENKEYGDENFSIVENIYADSRDMAVNMLDLSNIASRLKDFIGRKMTNAQEDKFTYSNILLLTSSPSDQNSIQVYKELRKIEEHISSSKFRDKISLNMKVAVKPETISKAMLDYSPDIVHFSGHGDVDGITIENDEGTSVFFPVEGLERLFSLFTDTTKCVCLNSCYSEEQARAISKQGVYVIGMNDSIDNDAAISFSMGFYQAIGAGKDIPFAFNLGMVLISQYADDANNPTLWKDGNKIK